MHRYRWLSPDSTGHHIAEIGLDVEPGQVFQSPVEIRHPWAVPVKPASQTQQTTQPTEGSEE